MATPKQIPDELLDKADKEVFEIAKDYVDVRLMKLIDAVWIALSSYIQLHSHVMLDDLCALTEPLCRDALVSYFRIPEECWTYCADILMQRTAKVKAADDREWRHKRLIASRSLHDVIVSSSFAPVQLQCHASGPKCEALTPDSYMAGDPRANVVKTFASSAPQLPQAAPVKDDTLPMSAAVPTVKQVVIIHRLVMPQLVDSIDLADHIALFGRLLNDVQCWPISASLQSTVVTRFLATLSGDVQREAQQLAIVYRYDWQMLISDLASRYTRPEVIRREIELRLSRLRWHGVSQVDPFVTAVIALARQARSLLDRDLSFKRRFVERILSLLPTSLATLVVIEAQRMVGCVVDWEEKIGLDDLHGNSFLSIVVNFSRVSEDLDRVGQNQSAPGHVTVSRSSGGHQDSVKFTQEGFIADDDVCAMSDKRTRSQKWQPRRDYVLLTDWVEQFHSVLVCRGCKCEDDLNKCGGHVEQLDSVMSRLIHKCTQLLTSLCPAKSRESHPVPLKGAHSASQD